MRLDEMLRDLRKSAFGQLHIPLFKERLLVLKQATPGYEVSLTMPSPFFFFSLLDPFESELLLN